MQKIEKWLEEEIVNIYPLLKNLVPGDAANIYHS
jgi:hypothetical protein